MTIKNRIKKLEQRKTEQNQRIIIWVDAGIFEGLAKFDGVEMPQEQAEKMAAELKDREDVFLIHICSASADIAEGEQAEHVSS